MLTFKYTENICSILDDTLLMIGLSSCVWSAVANRCLPDVNEIANLAVSITNANNETVSENQLQEGLEYVLRVRYAQRMRLV